MAQLTLLLLTWALSLTGTFAQSTCTGQQYNTLPGFPASSSGCYPLNYMSTSDLGNTNPSDAQSRCQQQCTSLGTKCGSVIAQVNKAADSNLYSGTCFCYAPGSAPTSPRSCANAAYLLLGYVKDSTLQCFSSSSAAATTFCQSLLGNTVTSTVSVLQRTRTLTSTNTATATTSTTTSITRTVSATSTVTTTTTFTTSTTVATNTVSSTTTAVTTVTSTATISSTTTVTVSGGAGSSKKRRAAAISAGPPACVSSGTSNTRLSAACSCFSAAPATMTKTVIATTPSTTITTTTTQTRTIPITSIITTTVTSATTTVTSSTTTTLKVTATTTAIITQQATSTVSATTTVVQTSSVTASPPLQTLILTVYDSQDPSLTSTGGIGFASLSLFDPGSGLNSYYIDFSADSASNQEFAFNPASGELTALNGPGAAVGNPATYAYFTGSGSFVLVSDSASASRLRDSPCVCQIVSGQLQCQYGSAGQIGVFWTCKSQLVLTAPDDTNPCGDPSSGYRVEVYAAVIG